MADIICRISHFHAERDKIRYRRIILACRLPSLWHAFHSAITEILVTDFDFGQMTPARYLPHARRISPTLLRALLLRQMMIDRASYAFTAVSAKRHSLITHCNHHPSFHAQRHFSLSHRPYMPTHMIEIPYFACLACSTFTLCLLIRF